MSILNTFFNGNKSLVKVDATELDNMRGQLTAINRAQAVIEFALDGIILNANHNFLSVMGYSLDEIKGRHHSTAVPQFVDKRKACFPKLLQCECDHTL